MEIEEDVIWPRRITPSVKTLRLNMLTSIDVKFIFDSASLSASIGGETTSIRICSDCGACDRTFDSPQSSFVFKIKIVREKHN